ncbi:MAG: hypothetical protein IJ043_01725 [Clostridia bacterium]|nr:hypothetical protein [Clostridia bacterium]
MVTRKTRLMSGFVAIMMIISLFTAFVIPVSAESGTVAGTGLYDATALPDIADGYTGATAYQVKDAAGLHALADIVNEDRFNLSGVTIYQTADIDLGWEPFAGIGYNHGSGTARQGFSGTYDGNGFIIEGLYIARTGDSVGSSGLFGTLNSGATVKNVGIASGFVYGRVWVGAIVGRTNGNNKILNCWSAATVVATDAMSAGGIVGSLAGGGVVAANCYNLGLLICSTGKIAGISGWTNNADAVLADNYNAGQIVGHFNGLAAGEPNCMYDYSPIVIHDYSQERATASENNYYVKGRGKISSVKESGLTEVPRDDKVVALVASDAATGVEASALTDGTLAAALNGDGLDYAPDGYTMAYENVEGVGYPVLTYRKDGAIVAQRTATATDLVNGDDTALANSTVWQAFKSWADGKGPSSIFEMEITLTSAADLWLVAMVSGTNTFKGTINLGADIDMADLAVNGVKYHIPIAAAGGNFNGTFDGQNHIIKNWTVYAPMFGESPRGGLISHVNGATVKNVGMVDSYTRYERLTHEVNYGYVYPALLVEREPTSEQTYTTLTMDNCFAEGTVYCENVNNVNNVGGVFSTAWGDDVAITNCWSDVNYIDAVSAKAGKGRAMGKLNTTSIAVSGIYQVDDGTFIPGADNLSDDLSTHLTDVSCKDASLAAALNEKMGEKWIYNGEYTTFAGNTAPAATKVEQAAKAAAKLAELDFTYFAEADALQAAYDALVTATDEAAATTALAAYAALTYTIKDGVYVPITKAEIYLPYMDTINWGISTFEDWAAFAHLSVNSYFVGQNFHLTNDIDMGNRAVDSVNPQHYYLNDKGEAKSVGTTFQGVFDGHGYVLKNYRNNINLTYYYKAGVFGDISKGTIKNFGVASGLVKCYNSQNKIEPLIGGLAGVSTNNAKVSYCWFGADIDATSFTSTSPGITISGIARTTNDGNVIDNCYATGNISGNTGAASYAGGLSGYSQASGEFYNCFYGGGTLSGKTPGLLRYNGDAKEAYFANTYICGPYSFDPQKTHANEANYELGADAYSTGELAYRLNTGYVEGKGTKGYYTLADSKTVFGTEANQTRKLTIEKKLEDGSLVESTAEYVNAGTVYTINAPAGYEPVAEGLNQYDAEAGTFVMPTTDATLVLQFSGEADALMQNIVDSYAPFIEGYEEDFDLFNQEEKMRASYNAALSVLEGTAEDVPAAVATATENFVAVANLTLKKAYPYYPSLRNIEVYKDLNTANAEGRINWGIHSVEDWKYLIEDRFDPASAKYLGSDPNTKINGKDGNYTYILNVTHDLDFNNEEMSPLYCDTNWTLDGHGNSFKNVNIVETIADPESATYVGLLGGQPWNVIIQNLGMEGGTVKVTGTNANAKSVYVSSFYGYNGGYSARLFNSWSTADVILDVAGGSDLIASGLINFTRPVAVTNCYFGGTVTSNGKSAVIWCTDGSSDEIYKNVWSSAEGLQFSNIANGASSTAGVVSADAVESGEIAYLLNNNYTACNYDSYYPAGHPYFDVVDGVTVRVDADPELRKITMKLAGYEDKTLYGSDGETVTLNYVDGASYAIASGNGTLEGDQLTIDGEAIITVTAENILILDELKAAVALYDGKNTAYYTNDNGDSLAEILATANGIIAGDVQADQAMVNAYAEMVKSFYLADAYPALPKMSEYATYPGLSGYLVYDLADLEAVVKSMGNLTAEQTIYLMADIEVTEGSVANSMKGLKASIDGNGYAIKNVHVVGVEDDWGGSAWLGNYTGLSIKNLVIDGWTTETMGWQAALLVSTASADTTFENITIKNSTVTGGTVRNGLGALIGIVRTTTITVKNIRIENTTLLRNSGNFGFVLGRNENGVANIDGVYLVNNTIGAVDENVNQGASGRGILVGESTGSTALKNIAVFNTSFKDDVTVLGVLAGCLKVGDDGASAGNTAASLSMSNIMVEDCGDAPLIYKANANGTCTYSNVYTDAEKIIGKNDEVANLTALTADQYTEAAFTMNLTSEIVKWEVPAEGYPEFDTDGKGLPLAISFSATDSDPTTTDVNETLFTNTEGKVIGITNELKEAAIWENADEWSTMTFTENTTISGTPITYHVCVWGNHSHIDGTDTHYAECIWTDGTIECPKTATQDCDFTTSATTVDPDAEPEAAAHSATCACGNTSGETLCSANADTWVVTTTEPTCDKEGSTIYNCTVCGYIHVDTTDSKGHTYPETWTKDEVAEGETQTHSHACINECGTTESEPCTYTNGNWEVTEATATSTGEKKMPCDKNCGSYLVEIIPALGNVTIEAETGIVGETMEVEVVLNNNSGLSGADITITYDSDALVLETVTAGDWELPLLSNGPVTEPDEDGMVSVIANFAIYGTIEEDGTIIKLTFKVKEDAVPGDYAFGVDVFASDFDGNEFSFIPYEGTVTVSSIVRGDINGDRYVTIADAVLMLRVASGETNLPEGLNLEAADIITETNTDEFTVNTDDVIQVLKYLNGEITVL